MTFDNISTSKYRSKNMQNVGRIHLCGVVIETELMPREWTTFQTLFRTPMATVRIKKRPNCDIFAGRLLANMLAFRVVSLENGCVGFASPSRNSLPCVTATSDYELITTCELDSNEATNFIRVALECRFCYEGIVSLHAACVEGDSYAVCFTGDSGVGKSTRAQAWIEGLGARFISGDRPAIRLEADGCTVCGVPWDGKEQIFRNVERPLTAIFEVRRAAFTRLRRLTADQAYGVLMRQSFIPMWDADAAALAMANVRRLSRSVPVYRLFCGPSAEDARAVYEILMNHPEQIREEKDDMKIRNGFVLRSVVDEYMVMPTGENIEKYDGAVVMNEVSAFVFQQLEHGISRDDLLTAVMNEFDVDEATAAADLDELLTQFGKMGLLED